MTLVFKFQPDQIFDAIEYGDVLYDLLDATGPWGLQIRMEQNELLQDAKTRISMQPDFARSCYERVKEQLSFVEEIGYANSKRTAIAAYMFLLYYSDLEEGRYLIRELAIQNRPNLLEVTELIREYAWRRPDFDAKKSTLLLASVSFPNTFVEPEPSASTESAEQSKSSTFITSRTYFIAV